MDGDLGPAAWRSCNICLRDFLASDLAVNGYLGMPTADGEPAYFHALRFCSVCWSGIVRIMQIDAEPPVIEDPPAIIAAVKKELIF